MTTAQSVQGKRISLSDFEIQVKEGVGNAIGKRDLPNKEITKKYKSGYSVDDTVSYFIMKS